MRHGRPVLRSARVSRIEIGASSPLDRLASLGQMAAVRLDRRPPRTTRADRSDAAPRVIRLGIRLPINLRQFLREHLGSAVRVEADAIIVAGGLSSEAVMRDLARGIRRFSAERSRQAWCESTVELAQLSLQRADPPEEAPPTVTLCLRCGQVTVGSVNQHSEPDCLRVVLKPDRQRAGARGGAERRIEAVDLLSAIEEFRRDRAAAGLSHFDLDCYAASGRVIFTWRQLPESTEGVRVTGA